MEAITIMNLINDDISIIDFEVSSNDFDDNKEYVLDIPYYNALDDGTMLLDNPPCLTCYLYL
jgi:hypothetical protein